ncbi:zinc finger and SCAN domain-containing protein 21-like isoform X2 [Thrips palmi]|uniref:Zinc finger and SCAN domain-containing protein 21-like isoform X2 n=1 Tax=Thrips palmi TaxID=161013 RepID=A0A6P8ZJZ3_THRPL|nr:zinc finger and SCAN domain-containing protein 21-like isoform X2 [Thrips palmi]
MSIQSPKYETEEYEEESPYLEGPVDIEGKCRLCLKANELIPVQNGENPEGGISTVALKIDILTTIKVAPTDKVCTVCHQKIKNFYSFRVMCLRSDARIRQASIPSDVSVYRPEHTDSVRSYKRVKRESENSFSFQHGSNDSLTIIPMPHNENGNSMPLRNKRGSGLTISAVPMSKEADRVDRSENGTRWDHDRDSGSEAPIDCDPGNADDCTDSQGDETENLEVQIDPFSLMGDDGAEPQYHQSHHNNVVNVRGQILYPVLGNNPDIQIMGNIGDLPPLVPGPHRPGPLPMTSVRQKSTSALDGSFLDKPFKCDVCPESFSYYKSFVKHKQRHSGELQPLKCEFCPDQFQTSRQLQNHLKYHNVEKAFPCDQCERSFPTKERLNSHYTLHTGNKPYVCEICNKSFAYKSSYGLHIRKQHGEQQIKSQSFKCTKCHEEFDIFVDFKRHLRTHAGEKPFTCNVCDKAFASKSILNVHSRIHNGLRPYRCDICGQAFTQKQSLDYHMRRHSEENPFKCEICGMTFQRRYFLDKHKDSQHGSPPKTVAIQQINSTGYEDDVDSSRFGDDDDDADSDPLKLEIDETSGKYEGDDGQNDLPVTAEIQEDQ